MPPLKTASAESERVKMFLVFLLCLILLLEVKSNNKYQRDINECYRVLIKQQQQINELEEKLKKII